MTMKSKFGNMEVNDVSMDYWVIEGVGVNVDKLLPHLNNRKCVDIILTYFPDDEDALKWKTRRNLKDFDIRDFLYGEPFDNFADLFTYCDVTDTLTYGDDGDGASYLYYPPTMPWRRNPNEPKSIEEVHKRIIDAVKTITDLTDAEIELLIDDDIYVVGSG